jgi:hypothetical protein
MTSPVARGCRKWPGGCGIRRATQTEREKRVHSPVTKGSHAMRTLSEHDYARFVFFVCREVDIVALFRRTGAGAPSDRRGHGSIRMRHVRDLDDRVW